MLDNTENTGSIRHLLTAMRLSNINPRTKAQTIQSVRAVRDALFDGVDVDVELFRSAIENADIESRNKIGKRHSQNLSDCRRAFRIWNDPTRRALALKLADGLPTMKDAQYTAQLVLSADSAARTVKAIEKLARSIGTTVENLDATAIVIEPLLRASTPEDFGVEAKKSLENIHGLIRAAVRVVDPNAVSSREADIKGLPQTWTCVLSALDKRTPEHAKAVTAIFRRLAMRSDREGYLPDSLPSDFIESFIALELATKAASHAEKMRSASRIWSTACNTGLINAAPFNYSTPQHRLPSVKWEDVPAGIREPLDDLLGQVESPNGDGQWSSYISTDEEFSDADLGLGEALNSSSQSGAGLREPGTLKNWRDAIKRTWHAALNDDAVEAKPQTFTDLYTTECVLALVRAVRTERRKRTEAEGGSWEKKSKGRYECSLVQTVIAVGRAMSIDEKLLAPIVSFVPKIDPSVVGSKIQADGTAKHVYEDRKIGPRHADMLKAFSDVTALRRFFEAPNRIWSKARAPLRLKQKLQVRHAALARSALILRIVQRVCPLRRSNIARLRIAGENPHIQLPVGRGEGTLYLPANEMKNLRAVDVRIDADTVEVIREFIEVFRPISMKHANAHEENEHLFPGGCGIRKERGPDNGYSDGFGYFTLSKLNNTFKKHLGTHSMINVDLHVMRHLAGKVILDQDPSAMGLVQEILAHKKIETTRAYYAEVCGLVAQARYLDLLDKATRKALANVSFKIQIEKELE